MSTFNLLQTDSSYLDYQICVFYVEGGNRLSSELKAVSLH